MGLTCIDLQKQCAIKQYGVANKINKNKKLIEFLGVLMHIQPDYDYYSSDLR